MLAFAAALVACADVRDYRGTWTSSDATLQIDQLDLHGIAGSLSIPAQRTVAAELRASTMLQGDALATMTFAGSPLHVYLAYFDVQDGCSEALAVISLYENRRIELRVLRGASASCSELFAAYMLVQP